MKNKLLRPEVAAIAAAAVLLTYFLMIKPILGVADNGDFGRIMGSTGLVYIPSDFNDRYFDYVNREFRIIPSNTFAIGYFSTEIPLVEIAKLINNIFHLYNGIFDIRFLALLYCIVLLAALYLVIKFSKQQSRIVNMFLVVLAVLVFADIGYVSYFNSLYGEAVSYSFLLLSIALAIYLLKSEQLKTSTLICFFLSAATFIGGKAQNAPLGILMAAFGIRLIYLNKDIKWKKLTAIFSALLVVVSLVSFFSIPGSMRVCNKYQSVFFGILKGSPTPEKDLSELGLNEELAVLAGTNYFMKEYPIDIKTPEIQKEISSKISPFKVAIFYAKHPSRYLEKLNITAKNGFKILEGFGSYEKSAGIGHRQTARALGLWSNFKLEIMPHSLAFIAILFGLYFTVLIFLHTQRKCIAEKIHIELFILVGLLGTAQFIVPIIGDGEADLSKHLFLFNVCFDIVFVTSVVWTANEAMKLAEKLIRQISAYKASS